MNNEEIEKGFKGAVSISYICSDCMEHENIKEYAKQHLKNKYEN